MNPPAPSGFESRRLTQWFFEWQSRCTAADRLLLERSVINELVAIRGLFELAVVNPNKVSKPLPAPTPPNAPSKERVAVDRLLALFSSSDPTIDLLTASYPNEIAALKALLASAAPTISDVHTHLAKIPEEPKAEDLARAIRRALRPGAPGADSTLASAADIFARILLFRVDSTQRKELPVGVMTAEAVRTLLATHIQAVAADSKLAVTVAAGVQATAARAETPQAALALFQRNSGAALGYRDVLALTDRVAGMAVGAHPGTSAIAGATAEAMLAQRLERLRRAAVERAVNTESNLQSSPLVTAGRAAGQWLSTLRGFDSNFQASVFTSLAIRSLGDVVFNLLADRANALPLADTLAISGPILAAALQPLLAEEPDLLATAGVPADRRHAAARRFVARRDVQAALSAAVDSSLPMLAKHTSSALAPVSSDATPWVSTAGHGWNSTRFWTEWARQLAARAEYDGSWASRHIDWSVFDDAEADAITATLADTVPKNEEWEVFFEIEGVDPQGKSWDAGAITWFAPGTFDFGERDIVFGGDGHVSPNRVRALVRVDAEGPAAAAKRGSDHLEHALNALTFALSVANDTGGFRPRVLPAVVTGRPRDGWSTGEFALPQHSSAAVQRAGDDEVIDFSKQYSDLVDRAARTPDQLTALEDSVVRALAWYARGRWEANPTSRFLAYFVAVEQAFSRGKMKADLPGDAAPIFTPWWTVPLYAAAGRRGLAIAKEVQAEQNLVALLNADPVFTSWRVGLRAFLDPRRLDQLESLARGTHPKIANDAQALAKELRKLATDPAPKAQLDEARNTVEFTLELLYARRNQVVHEALVSTPDVHVYADKMESLIKAFLHLTVPSVLHGDGALASVSDAEQWWAAPWF
jgi:hypothetical protein